MRASGVEQWPFHDVSCRKRIVFFGMASRIPLIPSGFKDIPIFQIFLDILAVHGLTTFSTHFHHLSCRILHEATEVLLTSRHKDRCPDIGALLVLFTVLQGDKSCPSREEFLQHYADENSLRWVMWWQRSNTPPQGAPVFQATQVSREILMFQMTVIEVVIGDVPTTLKDEPSCHPPGGY